MHGPMNVEKRHICFDRRFLGKAKRVLDVTCYRKAVKVTVIEYCPIKRISERKIEQRKMLLCFGRRKTEK